MDGLYTTQGGGCDDYGDPCPPWNGYMLTEAGADYVNKNYKKERGNGDINA